MKYLKEKAAPHNNYISKPKAAAKLKLIRVCLRLDCQRNFVAEGPFQRLCQLHREER